MPAFLAQLEGLDFETPRPLERTARMDRRSHGARHRANGEPALFRTVQSRGQLSLAMRGSNREPLQSAVGEFRLFARTGRTREPRHPGRRAPRLVGRGEAAGHFATGGSEANYTSLVCALTAAHKGFADDGVRAFAGPTQVLHLAGMPYRLAQDRPSSGRRPAGIAAHRHRRHRENGRASALPRHRRGSRARGGSGHDRRYGGHHRRRHDRPVIRLRRNRQAGGALVSRRCRLGRIRTRLGPYARIAGGHRTRRLHHHRCAQVARDHDGLRDVSSVRTAISCRRPFTPRRVSCPRASRRSIPTSTAFNGHAAFWGCGCFWRWERRAGRVSARMWNEALR